MKLIFAVLAAVSFLVTPVSAAQVCWSGKGRACVTVHPTAAPKFQALVNWLESKKYKIKFAAGTTSKGRVPRSLHKVGMAMDLNQTHRNRVTQAFPAGTTAKAASLGIFHGSQWCHKDTGHFQIGGFDSACNGRRARRIYTRHATQRKQLRTRYAAHALNKD